MYKIGYRENNISVYADIVPEDQDEKMFGLSIVYERNDEIKEWIKYYWTSKKSPQYLQVARQSLHSQEHQNRRIFTARLNSISSIFPAISSSSIFRGACKTNCEGSPVVSSQVK